MTCCECGCDPCVCDRKPSDTPERRKERVDRHRGLKRRFKPIGDAYVALGEMLPGKLTSIIDHMIDSGIDDIHLVLDRVQADLADLHYWGVVTGERLGELSDKTRLALQAYKADQERRPTGKKPEKPTDRSAEPWGVRLRKQLEHEAAWEPDDDEAPISCPSSSHAASFTETMAAQRFLGKGWARHSRSVAFKLDAADGFLGTAKKRRVECARADKGYRLVELTQAPQEWALGLCARPWIRPPPFLDHRGYRSVKRSLNDTTRRAPYWAYRQQSPRWAAEGDAPLDACQFMASPGWHAQKVREHVGLYQAALQPPMQCVP